MKTLFDEVCDEVGFDEHERELFHSCLDVLDKASENGSDPGPRIRELIERRGVGNAVQAN